MDQSEGIVRLASGDRCQIFRCRAHAQASSQQEDDDFLRCRPTEPQEVRGRTVQTVLVVAKHHGCVATAICTPCTICS